MRRSRSPRARPASTRTPRASASRSRLGSTRRRTARGSTSSASIDCANRRNAARRRSPSPSETTIEAMVRLAPKGGHLGCLNFASAKRPGGGFLGGAQAQEESLARASGLYPCLLTQPEYYTRNKDISAPALYSTSSSTRRTCRSSATTTAAGSSTGARLGDHRGGAERGALRNRRSSMPRTSPSSAHRQRARARARRAHEIERARARRVGRGVFGNDPAPVAKIFAELLNGKFANAFTDVVFAVLGTRETSANHKAFADVFG